MISAAWVILIPELVAFDSLCSMAFCALCSYYVYKVGYLLGAKSSTPQMASVFSDHSVLQGSFYPREVRLYAQILLAMSVGTLIWSTSLGLRTLEHEPIRLDDAAVSPKLPFTTFSKSTPYKYTPLTGSFVAMSPRQPPAAIRAACVSRIKKFVVLFCFCLAFLRRQQISTTLIYHPVNSPYLLNQYGDPTTLDPELSDEIENMSRPEGLDETSTPIRHNENVVPNIVHFVFGLDESFGGKPFAFAHYLSMYSGKLPRLIELCYTVQQSDLGHRSNSGKPP